MESKSKQVSMQTPMCMVKILPIQQQQQKITLKKCSGPVTRISSRGKESHFIYNTVCHSGFLSEWHYSHGLEWYNSIKQYLPWWFYAGKENNNNGMS